MVPLNATNPDPFAHEGEVGPRVSIVVPAYNRERYVGPTLESIRAQTFTNWEVVVFDDGSSDGTSAAAQQHADEDHRIRVARGTNGGVASARNRGFSATDRRSEFVIFLDSDDIWEPDALETLVDELEKHETYVSVHGLARCVDRDGHLVPHDDLQERMQDRVAYRGKSLTPMEPHEPVDFGALVYHNYVITPGIHLIRRAVIEAVGEFDPYTDPADDWDLAIRICRRGIIGYTERVVLNWRRHGDTLTDTSGRWKVAYYRVRRKMLTDPSNTPEQLRLARLGYLGGTRHGLHDAWSLALHREFKKSARQCAGTCERIVRYLVAAGSMKLSRRSESNATA